MVLTLKSFPLSASIITLAFLGAVAALPAHAANEEEALVHIEKQVKLIERVVDIMVTQRGEVLGAATVDAAAALKAQKATAEQARATATARLAALKKVASTTPAQKKEIATLQNQRIPALNAQIAALVKRIAALQAQVLPPKPAPVPPKPLATTTKPVLPPQSDNGEKKGQEKHDLRMTSPSVVHLTAPVRPVRITWQGSDKLDTLKLVITNETTSKVVVNTSVNPKQTSFDLTSPTPGEYLVQLFGVRNKKPVVFAGSLVLRGVPVAVPACTLVSDRETYALGDTARFTWTTKNATAVSFVPDTSGKDNLVPPNGPQKLNASVDIPMTVLGSPFITLSATGNGQTVSCKKTVTVAEARPRVIFGETGDNPDATTYEVEKNESSEGNTILVFSINSTSYDASDIAFRMFSMDVETNNPSGVSSVIDKLILRHNSNDIDGAAIEDGATNHATYMFTLDKHIVVTPGDTEIVEVIAFFKPQEGNYPEGTTVKASVDIERSPYVGSFEVIGHGIGETHTLRTGGALLYINGVEEHFIANSDSITSDDAGLFIIDFEVTAFEQDVYVPVTAVRGAGGGATYTMLSSTNSVVTTGTTVATLSSPATKTNGHYVVSEGETETFQLAVTYDPTTAGTYRLKLQSLNVKSSSTGSTQITAPPENYQTNMLLIKN